VTAVVGTLFGADDGRDHHFAVDDAGRLWDWSVSTQWTPHGTPAPDIRVRAPVGAEWLRGYLDAPVFSSVFVVGSDGNLWERTPDTTWRWVNHGRPAVEHIAATVAPLVVPSGDEGGGSWTEVPVLGADGRLWSRPGNMSWWQDRDRPSGRSIVGLVGGLGVSRTDSDGPGWGAVGTIAGDGHLWGWSSPRGWIDLGSPGAGDRAANGLGACEAWPASEGSVHGTSHSHRALQAVVVGRPSRRLWAVVWYPDMGAPESWQDLGSPPGVVVRGAVGLTLTKPNGRDLRGVVLGGDGGLWMVTVPLGGAPTWTSAGSPGSAVVAASLTKNDYHQPRITAVVATADGRLWSVPIAD
jgi:hypothetical protein